MLKLEIHGDNVGELYVNGVNMLLLLTRGGNAMFPTQPVADPVTPTQDAPPQDRTSASFDDEQEPVKPRRGRPPKAKPAETVDDDPLGLGDKKAGETLDLKALTSDDMKKRVKDILDAHAERGNTPNESIAYVRKLFAPFGIKLSADLKPEQFAAFWTESTRYLDGEAE